MSKTIQPQSPTGAVELSKPGEDTEAYFDSWIEGKQHPPVGVTVFWQKDKKHHFPWHSYGGMYQPNPETFDIYFDTKIVRGTLTRAKTPYPLNELWKAIEQKYLYALWDVPKRGLQVRVYKLVRTKEGDIEEQEI